MQLCESNIIHDDDLGIKLYDLDGLTIAETTKVMITFGTVSLTTSGIAGGGGKGGTCPGQGSNFVGQGALQFLPWKSFGSCGHHGNSNDYSGAPRQIKKF